MVSSLNSGVSALQQFQQQMNVIGNNIANVNTTGYKEGRTDFADTLSQTVGSFDGSATMQVGTGVTTSGISNEFTQGALTNTGVSSDLAISGDGFFVVQDTVSGAQYATRDGSFHVDGGGYLVNNAGLRVQGYSDAGLTTRGDIQIDATGAPASAAPGATVTGFSIDGQGKITVTLSDGSQFVRGQVLLQDYRDPESLVKQGGNLYSSVAGAGPLAQTEAPTSNGLGKIQSGALELSNVDLTSQFASLITAQRGFEAGAKVITTTDQILQTVVNLKQ